MHRLAKIRLTPAAPAQRVQVRAESADSRVGIAVRARRSLADNGDSHHQVPGPDLRHRLAIPINIDPPDLDHLSQIGVRVAPGQAGGRVECPPAALAQQTFQGRLVQRLERQFQATRIR